MITVDITFLSFYLLFLTLHTTNPNPKPTHVGMVAAKENITLKEQVLAYKEHIHEIEQELSILRGDDEALEEITNVSNCMTCLPLPARLQHY